MNAKLVHRMCAVVMGAALCLQMSAVMADIVPTDQLAAPSQAEVEKAKVQAFMDRADVKNRLQALGVNELSAKDRVAAMTDQEVHAMAQKIDTTARERGPRPRTRSGNLDISFLPSEKDRDVAHRRQGTDARRRLTGLRRTVTWGYYEARRPE